MKRSLIIVVLILATTAISVAGRNTTLSETDREAIKATALDYVEGWHEGNVERMERALHPDLAIRIVMTNPEGRSQLQQMSAMGLVKAVKRGSGQKHAKGKSAKGSNDPRYVPQRGKRQFRGVRLDRLLARRKIRRQMGDSQRALGAETKKMRIWTYPAKCRLEIVQACKQQKRPPDMTAVSLL